MKMPELLAPAGSLEKLKVAVQYGADAVYLGGQHYGLRAKAKNFSLEQIKEGVKYAHQRGAKVYVTVNLIPHNEDLVGLDEYIKELAKLDIDAVIVADPGVFSIVQDIAPELDIHISTQANNTNWSTVSFWKKQGASRVILARELSLEEISQIREQVNISLEAFIHGAMCISYSGRCLLSNYMINRDANRGECAHSCRWKYTLMEEKRPGEYYPVYEDDQGTYIFNSKDLCMIRNIPELVKSGLNSFKIEGRMKSLHYVATVTNVYRRALDAYAKDPKQFKFKEEWWTELKKVSHRLYTTGFYFGEPGGSEQNYDGSGYSRNYDFMGIIRDYLPDSKEAVIEVRTKFFQGDVVEIFGPKTDTFSTKIDYIINEEGERISNAPHPHQLITVKVEQPVKEYDLVRRKKGDVQ
ncbi:collagenase-like protease [Halobacteroides halobius DSM 5150]|uniref:Collagenase-like protease n=1 Tax=Halobacteroides halobius (strain ATCC 35273 / DSM 5150 / MD-1) TaxID=748449 RepID=L0K9I7_HALHC|nr:U32 family peptidase [Halobacteroides halobius]AGB41952.1 collagenase-like protease [Halobacteroides halobius DSM 5150]